MKLEQDSGQSLAFGLRLLLHEALSAVILSLPLRTVAVSASWWIVSNMIPQRLKLCRA